MVHTLTVAREMIEMLKNQKEEVARIADERNARLARIHEVISAGIGDR